MECKIITDRVEVEKLAEDIFLSADTPVARIDYDELCALRRSGKFGLAVIFGIDLSNDSWIGEFPDAVASLPIPFDKLQAFMINFAFPPAVPEFLPFEDILRIIDFFRCSRSASSNSAGADGASFDCEWSICFRDSLPEESVCVEAMMLLEREGEDDSEEKEIERMLDEYRKSKRNMSDAEK